jgi:hypothetical protein
VALGITYYAVKVVVYLMTYVISKIMKKDNAVTKSFGNSLFFGEAIAICVDAYIELLIAGFLNI